MNNIIKTLALFLLLLGGTESYAQNDGLQMNCNVGLQYQISYQNNWGANRPVIVHISPQSPAEIAGLKVGDIIESIDGQKTIKISEEAMRQLFLAPNHATVELLVSNFGYKNKRVLLYKKCRPANAIGEADLASAFSQYSIQDVTDRVFKMPFSYDSQINVDFSVYKTFAFAPIYGAMNEIDHTMQSIIAKALNEKGLKQTSGKADIIIKTSYKLDDNLNYNGNITQVPEGYHNYRYSFSTNSMQDFPAFAPLGSKAFVGKYKLSMGVAFVDALMEKNAWHFTAEERLLDPLTVESYAKNFLGLALMNFPFIRYAKYPSFFYQEKQFSYTGVYYDTNDLRNIVFVEPGSPAETAGLQAGDEVLRIDGMPSYASPDKLVAAYKDFVKRSLKLRDKNQTFITATGFNGAMPWAKDKYPEVFDMMQQKMKRYKPIFSYLFSFRPYIANPTRQRHVFDIKRDGKQMSIIVEGKLQNLSYLELK